MISKTFTTIICLFIFSSCATYSVVSTNTIDETIIFIQGDRDSLLGLKIQAGSFGIDSVERSNIQKDKHQSSNLNNNTSRMSLIKVPVEPGMTNLRIYRNGKTIYSKELYLGSGQIRKIEI